MKNMQLNRYIRLLSASLLLFALSMSAVAQRHESRQKDIVVDPSGRVITRKGTQSEIESPKADPKAASQPSANVIPLTLEEPTVKAMVFGQDGMLYILNEQGGRYNKGALYRLDPQGFSRLLRDKKNRYHAQPDDLTEVYVFGRPGEPSESFNPTSLIAGADGKLYISGHWQSCARYDPAKQSVEWVKYGPDNLPYGDPNLDLQRAWGSCFAATADGLLWCRTSSEGSPGKVFHTRGAGKDLGGVMLTEQWMYAALGADGYLYGATDDALIRVKTDGSDITVLHAFAGKNDHPVGAPILIGTTLFGCAHEESKISGEHLQSGYIYKLNADGTGYSTVVKLDYDPKELPFIAHGDSLYGIAPVGLFTLPINQTAPKIILPTKERAYRAAIGIKDNVAYLLWAGNQVDVVVYRVPITESAPVAASSSPAQTTHGPGPSPTDAAAGVATSNPAAMVSAPTPGGKSVFHKRQTTDDSQGAEGASAGSSSNAVDEGMSSKPRPGLPPRQSKLTAQVSSSVAPTRDAAPPPADETTGVAASNTAPSGSAAPVPGGKSVFHKRDNAVSTGAPPSQQGTAEQQPSSVSGLNSNNAPKTAGARSAGGGTPANTKKTKFPSNQTNDSGPLSGDTAEDASQTDAGAYEAAPGGSASSFGGLGSNRTNSNAGTSGGDSSDTSAIAGMVVEAYSNGDIATFASLYADTVDYMGHRRTSNADVQRQLSQYFAKWPVRQWQLVGTVSVRPVGPSAQRVAFSAQYDLSNPNTNSHAAGIANETLIVKDDGTGAMKITSHQEKVNSNSDSDTAGEKKRRRPNRERVYDGRPILPPNVPWPFPIPRP
jgi:hypothetical protein